MFDTLHQIGYTRVSADINYYNNKKWSWQVKETTVRYRGNTKITTTTTTKWRLKGVPKESSKELELMGRVKSLEKQYENAADYHEKQIVSCRIADMKSRLYRERLK